MAIPKTLHEIDKQSAERLIAKHTKAGTGWWEGEKFYSDFVYEYGKKAFQRKLLRPPCGSWGSWETGVVSL